MTLQIKRQFEKMSRRLSLIFSTARVLEANGGNLKLSFSDDEIREEVRALSPFGFHSVPRIGSACVVAGNGDRNSSYVVAARSEAIERQADQREGVVQVLDGAGAALTLIDGKAHLKADRFVLRDCKEDLVDLNKELIEILTTLLSGNPGDPIILPPLVKDNLTTLLRKWG